MRVPDHGKLAPWRFVIVEQDQRDLLAKLLVDAYRAEKPGAGRLELEAMDQFARQAPTLVVALYSPAIASQIPQWEQELSCGAACMNLLRSEEHTSELQSLMRISYAVFCLKKKKTDQNITHTIKIKN